MATSIQVKRGITSKVAAYTPLAGELVLDTTTNRLYAGDGSTAGGNPVVASKKGVTDGSSAAAGEVGQLLESSSSSVSLTAATETNLTSIILSPGSWRLFGTISIVCTASALIATQGSLSTTSGSGASFPRRTINTSGSQGDTQTFPLPSIVINNSTNTTIYVVAYANWTSGTATAQGYVQAERLR